ncbi:MAG: hypothetical protein ACRC41_03415, partial [Sarcina sp.]
TYLIGTPVVLTLILDRLIILKSSKKLFSTYLIELIILLILGLVGLKQSFNTTPRLIFVSTSSYQPQIPFNISTIIASIIALIVCLIIPFIIILSNFKILKKLKNT